MHPPDPETSVGREPAPEITCTVGMVLSTDYISLVWKRWSRFGPLAILVAASPPILSSPPILKRPPIVNTPWRLCSTCTMTRGRFGRAVANTLLRFTSCLTPFSGHGSSPPWPLHVVVVTSLTSALTCRFPGLSPQGQCNSLASGSVQLFGEWVSATLWQVGQYNSLASRSVQLWQVGQYNSLASGSVQLFGK